MSSPYQPPHAAARRVLDVAGAVLRHPRRTAIAAVIAAVVAGVLGAPVATLLKGGGFADPASPSAIASQLVGRATGQQPDQTVVALVTPGDFVTAPASRKEIVRVRDVLAADRDVAAVVDPLSAPAAGMISGDRRSAYLVATLSSRVGSDTREVARRISRSLASDPRVLLGGSVIGNDQVQDQVSADLERAELLAFPILFVLSFLVFRGLVAAAMPLMVGGLTIVVTFVGLRAVNAATDLSVFALNLVTGAGLGLAIDYSLLIISRYREERRSAGDLAALQRTLATAGRTVLFSSLTVTAALASLLVFPEQFLYSMGAGGAIVALVAATTALTVLPAVLLLLGDRIDSLSVRRRGAEDGDRWYRLSRLVMRHPLPVAAVTGAVLVALGVPFLGIRFTSVDASVLPATASARQVDTALRTAFATDTSAPIDVVLQAPPDASLSGYAAAVGAVPGVRAVAPPRDLGSGVWVVAAYSASPPLSQASEDAVDAVRAIPVGYPAYVGGHTAQFLDLQASLRDHLPLALTIIAVTTLLVLFALTGSVVLPVKALIMNALTLSAAFGILVLVFQDGRLTGLLRYTSQGALESTQPVLLFAIAFGLSTDYGVFLLSRIKEGHDAGMSTTEAVARGLERTGRIVTAAALLFCVAVGTFATSSIVFIKELGVGTAVAVIIDSTIVRALLVPSLMALLGRVNWWAPAPLRVAHRRLGLERVEGDRPRTDQLGLTGGR